MKQTQKEWARYIQDEIQKNLERKTVKEWIKYIQEKIRNNSDYDSVYEGYKTFLENKLKENPKNVEVVCQLAAVYNELNYQWDDIYKLLNEFIKKYENECWLLDCPQHLIIDED